MNATSASMEALRRQTKAPSTLTIIVTFTALSTISVVLRFITRFLITRNAGIDDYLVGVSLAFSIAMLACMIMQINSGTGQHAAFLTLEQAIGSLKFLYWSIFNYVFGLTLAKLSILVQYLRIFALGKKMRALIHILMGVVIAYGTESFFINIFSCNPIHAFWDIPLKTKDNCLDSNTIYLTSAIFNMVTNVSIAIVPIPLVIKLDVKKNKKLALAVLLVVGWFVCVVSMLRINALVILSKNMKDTSYYGGPESAYWSSIEFNTAIICGSLPAIAKLLSHCWDSMSERAKRRRSSDISFTSKGVKGMMKGTDRFIQLEDGEGGRY